MNTSQEWREFARKPGAITTVMSRNWLLDGCPKCGCKTWQVTNDCYAYCDGCAKGYSTAYPFTHAMLSRFDRHGLHCFMCDGYGERDGEVCDECRGKVTQPKSRRFNGLDDTGSFELPQQTVYDLLSLVTGKDETAE